jgi:hypothetical protein
MISDSVMQFPNVAQDKTREQEQQNNKPVVEYDIQCADDEDYKQVP